VAIFSSQLPLQFSLRLSSRRKPVAASAATARKVTP